jgi:hypothetical protein
MAGQVAPIPVATIVALMRASTDAAASEVRALGELARWRPGPGEWCANEVLGHLFEADRHGFTGRMRQAVDEDRPVFLDWDQSGVAAARHDDEADPEALVAAFLAQRDADLPFVAGLGAADLARTGIHEIVGELSVSDLLHEWVHHDRAHLGQLTAITQSLAWPSMGNARRFSDPSA